MTKLHHGEYVHLDILPDGNLRVTLTEEGLQEERENRHKDALDDDVFYELYAEDHNHGGPHGNGGPYLTMDISEVDGGHLSNAPAIVSDWRMNTVDQPDHVDESYVNYLTYDDSRIWYWNEYMIISILEHIKKHGEAVLTKL